MPAGSARFPVFSLASRGLLASSWKVLTAPYRQPSLLHALSKSTNSRRYSSIADAMLGRAVKDHAPPPSKNELAKQLFPSSSPAQNGNIEEEFKKARQSSQSIGGFVGGFVRANSTSSSNPLRARSPNVKQPIKRATSSIYTSTAPSLFSKQDSFDTPNSTLDISQYNATKPTMATATNQAVHFDENDFDDDEDLDLDMEFDLPLPMAAPPKPSQKAAPSPSLPPLRNPSQQPYPSQGHPSQQPYSSQNQLNSAATWSSSSPSHKATPPGALKRKQEQFKTHRPQLEEKPRPIKRRTLPWAQQRAEDEEIALKADDIEDDFEAEAVTGPTQGAACFRCKGTGHYASECQNIANGKKTEWSYTPVPKDKHMPWNTTGSAVAEEKKKFKDMQKAKRKADETDAMEGHQRGKAARKAVMTPITLSKEQERVLDLVVNHGKSVFFTGSAGTGKSVLMRAIIADLRRKFMREPDRVAVTASTGLAACNIGGVTLHSFGGIGLGKEDVPTLVKKIKRNAKAKNRWMRTKILIVDEISMVDGDLFDKLEGIARAMRNNGRPFGGIQLVITGDFFQLPPVPDFDNKARGVKFAFDAGTWSTAIHHTIGLTEVFRQKDPVFANMLNEMRLGKITDDTIKAFRSMSRKVNYEDALCATELFPTRNEVDNANALRMRDLVGKIKKYEAKDTGTILDEAMREKLLQNVMAPKCLELKKGSQVMLIKNLNDSLVNGSLGKVISFMDERTFSIYSEDPDSFENAYDETNRDFDTDTIVRTTNIKAKLAANKSSMGAKGMEYPLVRFSNSDGSYQTMLVQPEDWKIELPNGEVQAQRTQLPLILAWALSIHKAQGQTLERVKIDLKKIFEKGQAYVALSRATSQAGLEVLNFDKSKVMAHPRVAEFYNSLYSVNKALEYPKVADPPAAKPSNKQKERDFKEISSFSKAKKGKAENFFQSRKLEEVSGYDLDEEEAMAAAYG